MSGKRSANEYITKEHGSTFLSGREDDPPRQATAAQMATRKTATPRGRLNRTGTPQRRFPPSTGNAVSMSPNPFAGANTQSFGAPTAGGPVSFGAQPTNNSSGFNFSANTGNNPFANINNNPFAASNGNTSSQQNSDSGDEQRAKRVNTGSTGSSFQFGQSQTGQNGSFTFGASQSQNQTQTQTPSQQPQTQSSNNSFSSLFGNSTQNSSPAQSPKPSFSFGQTNTTQQSQTQTPLFGAFGQNKTSEQNQTGGFNFGQNSTTQSAAEQQPAKPAFTFGATAASTQQQAPATTVFSFGTSTSTAPQQPSTSSIFGGAKSTAEQPKSQTSFTFGTPATSAKPAEEQQTSKPKFIFGASSQTSTTQQEQSAPLFSFGTQPQAAPEQQKEKSLFPAATEAQSPKPAGLFGAPAQESAATKATSLFGSPAKTTTEQQPASKPPVFSFGAPAATTGGDKPVFSGGLPGTSGHSLFGSPAKPTPKDTEPTPSESAAPPSINPPLMFGADTTGASKPTTDAAPTSGSTPAINWGQPKTSEESNKPTEQAAKNPFASLFGKPATSTTDAPSSSSTTTQNLSNKEPAKASGVFGGPTPTSGGLFTPAPPKPASSSQEKTQKITTDAQPSTSPKKQLFGTLSQPVSEAIAEQPTVAMPKSTGPPNLGGTAPVKIQRQVYTKSPARIPSFLNGEGYKEYDNNYRLRALNKEFKKKMIEWDADRYDIEPILRHYVSARASIGGDIGLYQRALAGTKRKSDDSEEESNLPPQYKKARFDSAEDSQPAPAASRDAVQSGKSSAIPSASQTVQQARPTSTEVFKTGPNLASPAPTAPKPQSTSSAASMFNNMIPASPQKSVETPKATPAKPNNPFASVPSMPDANKSFSWGNTVNAGSTPKAPSSFFGQSFGSTTPQKSPPKNSLFGASSNTPSFGQGKKRKEIEDDDDLAESSSEDESRKKRSKLSPKKTSNIFGTAASSQKKSNGPFEEDSPDEEDADAQNEDDQQDSDFAPNADGSDSDGSEEDEYIEESDDIAGVTQQEESETSHPSDEDHSQEIENNPNKGKSIFDRIEMPAPKAAESTPPAQPAAQPSAIKWPTSIAGISPEGPAFSPITPATVSPYKPSTTFNFTPTPATKPAVEPGSSVLSGGSTNGGFSKFEGMFGSRPSTPEPEKPKAFSAPTSTPAGDNTWKQGTPIKFNSNVVPPSPQPDKESTSGSSLFGKTSATQANSSATGSLGFAFGKSTQPSYLESATHLAPESAISSGISSRATSPGLSENESVATNDTSDDAQNDPQSNLMDSRPGEENENVLMEVRAKALVMANKERATVLKIQPDLWTSIGLGNLRVLKHKDTGKTRVVMRAEPGANLLINSNLYPSIDYAVRDQGKGSGAINARFDYKGGLDHVVLKVRSPELAKQIADLLNEHKSA